MSALGRVSRGSPVQTAMRNCTRDEGRSFVDLRWQLNGQARIRTHAGAGEAESKKLGEKPSYELKRRVYRAACRTRWCGRVLRLEFRLSAHSTEVIAIRRASARLKTFDLSG
jgi:hypothetical protein